MKMLFNLILLVFLHNVNCWPDLRLYTRQNPSQAFVVTEENFANSPFQNKLETVMLIHGFMANTDQDWIQEMKNTFLEKTDLNVILVDWKDGAAGPNYPKARDNVRIVGKKVNEFIRSTGIDPKTIYCTGHSLGAHSCGMSAKGLVFKRITGMDPAGPLFRKSESNDRLDIGDALLVDIINTDGCLGIHRSLGHKNFYPNGGMTQAGCTLEIGICAYFSQWDSKLSFNIAAPDLTIACSHKRSYEYYNDSMKNGCNFKSALCKDWDDYEKGICKCDSPNDCATMGYHADQGDLHGDFYLHTNKAEPFCQNR